jgi:hypothetical protein
VFSNTSLGRTPGGERHEAAAGRHPQELAAARRGLERYFADR